MASRRWLGMALAGLLAGSAGAVEPAVVAETRARGTVVDWTVLAPYQRAVLTVATPDGEVVRSEIGPGSAPTFSAFDEEGEARPDGSYNWELRLDPVLTPDVERGLAAALLRGDERAVRKIQRAHGLERELVQSGSFVLSGGAFVTGDEAEADAQPAAAKLAPVTAADYIVNDDLIVRGNACIGACANGMSFVAPLVVRGLSPNIFFDDIASSSSVQPNDWAIYINAPSVGQGFSVVDYTAGTLPFTLAAGAPTNSVFVDSRGRVGLGTSTPVHSLHIKNRGPGVVSSTAIRLDTGNRAWDIYGNFAGSSFAIIDTASGNAPLVIEPNSAQATGIRIASDGQVGINTQIPESTLHVYQSIDANTLITAENPNTGTEALGGLRSQSDVAIVSFQSHGSGRTLSRFGHVLGGWNEMLSPTGNGLIIGTLGATPLVLGTNDTSRVEIGGTGGLTVTGDFTVTGGTKNFAVVDPEDERRAIYYAALEGPEAGTYIRGKGQTRGGEATISLPGYFAKMTEAEGVTVQLTPVGGWSRLYVAEQGAGRLVVRVADGDPDVTFNYQVQGVRKGYRDFAVERPNTLPPSPAPGS